MYDGLFNTNATISIKNRFTKGVLNFEGLNILIAEIKILLGNKFSLY